MKTITLDYLALERTRLKVRLANCKSAQEIVSIEGSLLTVNKLIRLLERGRR